ncbi:hypothetical protein KY337_02805 [Candidatus Woesearchaeota archaeon]|nr:hypothetical protein [Candidatus Woesearchaeota archaeon]
MTDAIRMDKLQYALKHLSRAAVRVKERHISRKDLDRRIQSLKSSALKGKDVSAELEELDVTLRQVLKNEREMLEQQKRFVELLKKKLEGVSPDVEDDIDAIKKQLDRNMASENLHAVEFKNKIDQLGFGLSEVEREELDDLRYTRDQVDRTNRSIGALQEKLDLYAEDRNQRMQRLEKRIRSDVQQNRKQLLLIEQEIRHLERKSRELKSKGLSKEALGKVEEKISTLKKKSKEIMQKYPPSTGFVPKKLELKKPEEEWKAPAEVVKKKPEKEKEKDGVSELKIPPLKKEAIALPPKPPKVPFEMPPEKEVKLEPDLGKFDIPKEFEPPKKLSAWQKLKDWLGL